MNWHRTVATVAVLIALILFGINAAAELICRAHHVSVCGG